MIGIIAGIVLAILLILLLVVLYIRQKRERSEYYLAAYKVIKETALDQALHRNSGHINVETIKPMVYIKSQKGQKEGFVFDPEKPVGIGRAQEGNALCVRDASVSGYHCRLFLYGSGLYVEDLGSTNGTWLRQGFAKKQIIGPTPIRSGAKLYIGGEVFRIVIFHFDTMLL